MRLTISVTASTSAVVKAGSANSSRRKSAAAAAGGRRELAACSRQATTAAFTLSCSDLGSRVLFGVMRGLAQVRFAPKQIYFDIRCPGPYNRHNLSAQQPFR